MVAAGLRAVVAAALLLGGCATSSVPRDYEVWRMKRDALATRVENYRNQVRLHLQLVTNFAILLQAFLESPSYEETKPVWRA